MRHLWIAALALLGTFVFGTTPAEAQTRWLVMVYVAADNDMEPALVDDVIELTRAAANPNVEVLVQIDRSRGWNSDADPETQIPGFSNYMGGIRRFRIRAGAADGIVNPGAGDSGSGTQLEGFLNWALDNASADFQGSSVNHALVMIGPGEGWRGALQDTSTRMATTMTAAQMGSAIEAAYGASHVTSGRLRLIGVGASLFGTVENALDLSAPISSDTTARLVLSEEIFPATGFAFQQWLESFASADADLTPAGVAQMLVLTCHNSIMDSTDHVLSSISVAGLRGAGSGFTSSASTMATNFDATRDARGLAEARGSVLRFGTTATNDRFGLVDARRLLAGAATRATSWDGVSAAAAALDRAVVYIQRGEARLTAGGLSMYLPEQAHISGHPAARVDAAIGSGTEWADFVGRYVGRATMDTMPPAVMAAQATEEEAAPAEEGSGGGTPTRRVHFTATTVGDDIDAVTFVLGVPFEGGVAFFGETPVDQGGGAEDAYDGGVVDIAWDGTWMALASSESPDLEPAAFFVLERYMDAGGMARTTYVVPVRFDSGYEDDGVLEEGVLIFDVDAATLTGELVALYALDDTATESDGVYELDVTADTVVIPMVPVVSDAGDYELLEVGVPIATAGLMVAPFAVGDGFYEIGLSVSDLYGNESTELASVFLGEEVLPPASGGCSAAPGTRHGSALALAALAVLGLLGARRRRIAARTALTGALVVAGCSTPVSTIDAGRDTRPLIEDAGPCADDDMDDVCDWNDACYGHDDGADADGDSVPDGCDCNASGSACDANATCSDGDEGVVCYCNPGYVGEGDTCTLDGEIDGGAPDGGVPTDGGTFVPTAVAVFVDAASDRATLVHVDAAGQYVRTLTTTGDPVGNWDYATGVLDPAGDTARVLFHSTTAGGGRYVEIDVDTGAVTTLIATLSLSAWTDIVPVACSAASCDRYVFHNAGTGVLAVVDFRESGGTWTPVQTDSGTLPGTTRFDDVWRMAWDDAGVGYLGLHRGSDGFFGRVGVTTATGMLVRAAGVVVATGLGGTFAGFDLAVAVADLGYLTGPGSTDLVFVYRSTGAAQLGRLSPGSATGLTDWAAGSWGAWSDVVTLDNGVTLFYDPDAAPAELGRFDLAASPPAFAGTDTEASLSTGYEHVTALVTQYVP